MKFHLAAFNLALLLPFVASQCTDEPGWVVDHVYDCDWFESQPNNCDVFGEGTDGLTAKEACCACGKREIFTKGPTRAPTRGPTRAPTLSPADVTVSDYRVASVTAFDEEDMEEICKDAFGSRATVAEWNDFDDMSATRLEMTLESLDLRTDRKYFVTFNGRKYFNRSLRAYYASSWNGGSNIDTLRIGGAFALALRAEPNIAGRPICKTVAISTWD